MFASSLGHFVLKVSSSVNFESSIHEDLTPHARILRYFCCSI